MKSTLLFTALVVLISAFLLPSQANAAYLDPGSGSFIVQLVIAALLGGLVAAKMFWNRITSFFTGLFRRSGK